MKYIKEKWEELGYMMHDFGWLGGIMFVILIALSHVWEFIWRTLRLPARLLVCSHRGHDWMFIGGGFFAIFETKKPFICKRCGKAERGDTGKFIGKTVKLG